MIVYFRVWGVGSVLFDVRRSFGAKPFWRLHRIRDEIVLDLPYLQMIFTPWSRLRRDRQGKEHPPKKTQGTQTVRDAQNAQNTQNDLIQRSTRTIYCHHGTNTKNFRSADRDIYSSFETAIPDRSRISLALQPVSCRNCPGRGAVVDPAGRSGGSVPIDSLAYYSSAFAISAQWAVLWFG